MPREDDIRKIVTGGRARGLSDDQIRSLVARYDARQGEADQTEASTPAKGPKVVSRMSGIDFISDADWEALPPAEKMRGALKAAGTVVGSMFMGPEMAREKMDHPIGTLAEFGVPVAAEKVLAPGLIAGAKGLYRSVLKPGKAVREATVGGAPRAGGAVATEELLKNGIPITRSGRGQEMVRGLMSRSRQSADDLVAASDAAGQAPMSPIAGLSDMAPVMSQAQNVAALGKPSPVPGVLARARAFLAENPNGLTMTRAQALKRTAQSASDDSYRALERGQVVDEVGALFDKQQAMGLRKALERRVPGLAAQNANTQRLGTAAKAIAEAEGRIANNNMVGMGDALSLGTGLAGWSAYGPEGALVGVLQSLLTRPESASRIAIGGYKAGKALQAPSAAKALAVLMASHQAPR